ncbi:cation:proton antiporter [Acidovorax sp. SUPP950]|uniref:cation:proton antiporter n=1 Tax=unclassified Acidovorax TaxID=2684926 RepID=UPI00234A0BF7|nr:MULTISPECIES: cation:proton antiporter [Comamonadaceae]WCM97351.1 cation:proton antiporter [Acidovorax sp. GBBC 1281]WOI44507.1 cation:proton antiporter [Paracidovorax avenae]GKS76990.1 cation:proton antiporter [Acidovorax sp. SUPP950]GKS85347.1 cation:proton antiporter [Acidovorax sp. SUPP1855]GKS91700.1 cation:proton antiporter [Acidovorax sp. SUPP2539]
MDEILSFWAQWLRPSAGLPTVQWSLLLAVAAVSGYLFQRHIGLPKVVGYTLVGTIAGLLGFTGAVWPLQGISLFLLELGIALVLFEAGGRIPLRWFRHNPMVLVQSIAESALTYFAVYYVLMWLDVPQRAAGPLALVALAASPAVLSRVVADTRAAGPVTDRAMVLATLSTLYALTLGSATAELINRPAARIMDTIYPVMVVLGVSIIVGAVLALVLRMALRFMSPTSENTSFLLLTLIAAGTAVAAHMGGSAPLAALLAGMLLKQLNPRPWAWPRQMGTASSLLTMLMFVLVSTVAAQADWSGPVAGVVLALIVVRLAAKALGVAVGNVGSGASWRQALWVGCAMTPMSSIALLIASQFVVASASTGQLIARVALPAILVMEVLGAVIATVAIYRAGESSKPWAPLSRAANGDNSRES